MILSLFQRWSVFIRLLGQVSHVNPKFVHESLPWQRIVYMQIYRKKEYITIFPPQKPRIMAIWSSFYRAWMCNFFLQQNSKVEAVFTLMLQRFCFWGFFFSLAKTAIIYFPAQTSAGVCYWKSICTFSFRKPFTRWNGEFFFLFFAVVYFLSCCQWKVVTVTFRGSRHSQAGPPGPDWACFVLVLNFYVGRGLGTFSGIFFFPCSNCMHP